ncbi:MAG: glycosyltransferase family 4 protein [Candidatus Cloacimonadales bacterium]
MKILMITNLFPPHFIGGYELSCQEVTNYFHEQGEELFVLCGDYKKDEEVSAPYPVSRKLQYIDYLGDDYWQKSRVEKYNYALTTQILEEFQPDFVYFFNQQYITLAPYWAVSKKKLPHIFDIGDMWPDKYYRDGFKGKSKAFAKRILPNFIEAKMEIDPVIILSEWMRPFLKNKFHAKSITCIPRGVQIKDITRDFSKLDSVKLMFSSRLDPVKGLHVIIGVLANLQDLKWTLDVYGSGSDEYVAQINKLIDDNNLNDRITLNGKVYPLDEAYKSHHVCLFPTLGDEGFGRVAIEAMSFGLPVLTVNKFGPNDVVEHGYTGFKCPKEDLSCWEKHLRILLSDRELLNQMSKNALKTIKEEYDINVTSQKRYVLIKEIYNSK